MAPYKSNGPVLSATPWIYCVFDSEFIFGPYTFRNLLLFARFVMTPLHDLVWNRDPLFKKLSIFLLIQPFIWTGWEEKVTEIVQERSKFMLLKFHFICMSIFPACMSVFHLHAS